MNFPILNPRCAVALLIALFTLNCFYSARQKSVTIDEFVYIASGYSYLTTFDYRLNPEHPPAMKLIIALPLLWLNPKLPPDDPWWNKGHGYGFARQFFFEVDNNTEQLTQWARTPVILLATLLGFYVFLMARQLYGSIAGILALFCLTFSPNILAHARLATLDLGVTCFAFIACFYLLRYKRTDDVRFLLVSGCLTGLSIGSKFTGVFLIPVFLLLLWPSPARSSSTATGYSFDGNPLLRYWRDVVLVGGSVVTILLLLYGVVNIDHLFNGIADQSGHFERGHDAYLFGNYSTTGWPYYFPLAFLVKTPVPVLVLFLLAAIGYRRFNPDVWRSLQRDSIVIVPFGALFVLSAFSPLNLGLRNILPVYPFLFVFVSQLAAVDYKKTVRVVVITLMAGWLAFSSLYIAPHYLAYFNELVGGPRNGPKYLLDSNIDWGQDLKLLARYLRENDIDEVKLNYFGAVPRCERYGISCVVMKCEPEPGLIAVSVNSLYGLTEKESHCFQWLRQFEPIETIGFSIYLYRLTQVEVDEGGSR